jgi:hypothetical protein
MSGRLALADVPGLVRRTPEKALYATTDVIVNGAGRRFDLTETSAISKAGKNQRRGSHGAGHEGAFFVAASS